MSMPVFFLIAAFAAIAWQQDAEELFRKGGRLFAERNVDAALAAFQQAVELQPDHAPAWKALGVAYASRGEYESAEAPFRKACELRPALPDACLYLGRTLYLLNRFPAAIAVLRRSLNGAESYRLLALSHAALGQTPEAGDAFRAALRLYRTSAPDEDPGIDYGVFLTRQGQAEQATGTLEAALKRHPDSPRAHLELACTLLELDNLPDAAAHLERSLALDGRSARAHLLLGKVYLRMGKPEAAEEHLRLGSLVR